MADKAAEGETKERSGSISDDLASACFGRTRDGVEEEKMKATRGVKMEG